MIRLDQDKLRSLYPAPDAAATARLHRCLHDLPEERKIRPMKKMPLRLALIAALLMFVLTASAVALSRPAVLDWLLGHGPASDELTQVVQEVVAEAAVDGVTLRVTGVVYDGCKMAFAYEAEAADPTQAALFALDPTFTVNGQAVRIAQFEEPETYMVPTMHLDLAPVQRNPNTCGQMISSLPGLSGKVQCEMTFRVYRPEKAFVFLIGENEPLRCIDDYPADYQADLRDQLTAMQSLRNAIIPDLDRQDAAEWVAQGYTVEGKNLRQTAEVTLCFAFDADATLAHDFSNTPDIPLDEAVLHIEQLLLSPLQTDVDVYLIPQENTEAAARALMARQGECVLTDDGGKPVAYSQMDYLADYAPYVTEVGGQWVCRYCFEMPGLAEFPESVGFATEAGELARFDLAQGQE